MEYWQRAIGWLSWGCSIPSMFWTYKRLRWYAEHIDVRCDFTYLRT